MRTIKVYFLLAAILCFCGCNEQVGKSIENEDIGEFSHRMEMTKERLSFASKFKPVFTPEFILADVNINLENPRRFDNYSGDISGRYIEAFSCGHEHCHHLDYIVKQALLYQHPDGRFGDPTLVYKEKLIGVEHMPLLWGNGRLLVGLLEYYEKTKDEKVLQAAVRLGDFFLSIYNEVTPDVVKRLEEFGAAGIICFTQYVEPLVMLAQATKAQKYADAAHQVYLALPQRGNLHTHGYLTTLRGALNLYEYDKQQQHLDYVIKAYDDLVKSNDYTIYGSVKEYFGGSERDEGCSTVDFIRLSLHLYKVTQNIDYLERAEFSIHNALFFNQFFTGDFGSHHINNFTSNSDSFGAAWWCCTMAGLRAMQIVNADFLVENNENLKLNLYLDADYSNDHVAFSIRKGKIQDDFHVYDIRFSKAGNLKAPFLIRNPPWGDDTEIVLNGKKINCSLSDGYFAVENQLTQGDVLQIKMKYQTKLITPDKTMIKLDEITKPVKGALCYGPYIMAVDKKMDFTFTAEPNNNIIYSNTIANGTENSGLRGILNNSFVSDTYLTANYKHEGFPSCYQTVFRPISEMTFQQHPYMMVSLTFALGSAEQLSYTEKTWVE